MNAEEVELGEEIADFPRQPRAGTVVSVRLSIDEAKALHDLAESTHTTLSNLTYEAIIAYLEYRSGRDRDPASVGTASGVRTSR